MLIDAFRADADVHTRTARAIFGVDAKRVTREMRGHAKTVNFGVIYGQSEFALARNLRIDARPGRSATSRPTSQRYAGVAAYMERSSPRPRETGRRAHAVRPHPPAPRPAQHRPRQRQAAERIAQNTPIQGTAADIIKLAMIAIRATRSDARKLQSKMLLTVHDELVFEAPPPRKRELEEHRRRANGARRRARACRWSPTAAGARAGARRISATSWARPR